MDLSFTKVVFPLLFYSSSFQQGQISFGKLQSKYQSQVPAEDQSDYSIHIVPMLPMLKAQS